MNQNPNWYEYLMFLIKLVFVSIGILIALTLLCLLIRSVSFTVFHGNPFFNKLSGGLT